MKNTILSFSMMLLSMAAFCQVTTERSQAIALSEELTIRYNLDEKQQAEMLTIQERKFKNLGEIESLKKTDPVLHIKKVKALTLANDYEMEKLLNKEQFAIYYQGKVEYRKQKAEVFQEMKEKGASQTQIDYKISLIEEEALLKS